MVPLKVKKKFKGFLALYSKAVLEVLNLGEVCLLGGLLYTQIAEFNNDDLFVIHLSIS